MDSQATNTNLFIPEKVLLSENKLLKAPDIVCSKPIATILPTHIVASQKDWAFFTLEPILRFVRHGGESLIDFDLITQFQSELLSSLPLDRFTYKYSDPVFVCNDERFYILECIPVETFKHFKSWLLSQMFSYTAGEVSASWKLQAGEFQIRDPLANTQLATITFFLPYTNRHKLSVKVLDGIANLQIESHKCTLK